MPPSVHSPSPDHARHVHEEPLQSGLQPKVINKRPTITSTTAGATAPTTSGVESRRRPSSLPRTPQSVTPPSSTEVVGPVAVRRRMVGSAQASSERPLVQRKKRSVPGNNVDAGRASTESETTTTPSPTIQGTADNISGVAGVGANQMSTMGMYGSPYGLGMSPYGGMGMYSGMGMYGGGMMMGGAGPFSGLNNFLFGFQSVVFSLGQAMQILGMNTHALQQLFHTAMSFFDNAISTLNEIRALNIASASDEEEMSEEEIKRRRRLKALRWSLVMGVSYAGYKLMRRWLLRRRQLRHMIATGVNPGQSVDAGMGGGEPTHANRYSPYGPPAGGSSYGYGYGSSNNMLMNGSQYGYDGFGSGGGAYGSRYSPYSPYSSSYGGGNYGGYGGYSGVNNGAGYFPGY